MPAREASSHRFFARRAIESSPLQLHLKTVSQLYRWGHNFLLLQLDWLDALQLVHGNMHFPCANLIVKPTVLLARSNAFQGHQNGAESMLRRQLISSNRLLLSRSTHPQCPKPWASSAQQSHPSRLQSCCAPTLRRQKQTTVVMSPKQTSCRQSARSLPTCYHQKKSHLSTTND